MHNKSFITAQRVSQARELVECMEAGDDAKAGKVMEELVKHHESFLFDQLGRMTRDLHDALSGFQIDSRISALTENDIPDAKERLSYVITMTEQAAHRTLSAVEEVLPLAELMKNRGTELNQKWGRYAARKMDESESAIFGAEVGAFLDAAAHGGDRIHHNLSDVLMAQDYQDLTGQIIRRVISLVKEVEENLVQLVRASGQRMGRKAAAKPAAARHSASGHGPVVPGVDDSTGVATGQDDVDELLSSLGF